MMLCCGDSLQNKVQRIKPFCMPLLSSGSGAGDEYGMGDGGWGAVAAALRLGLIRQAAVGNT